ncbi:Rrf2 family transcriptional regulator [Latilactobacillus fuchuensis]|uniref:Transcriptional regulator family protein n=1 Tax=Latilactobacillus fuchuensis DSM 14340 = JCM 11249 TaxID=1423747 RepID=A0A0R1S3L5_9LACO|nr:Rrf2 family transcriptional regulator [Latilactobacillus fuchuensis]KRL61298.1 transcriptional regulator family protein [Latilactobacillus fuchuensis DSM 14340 = JCM 11249]MCP8857151.1 Rrf2 family transcriptional regulator [Latilactobacillus fuchuensis]
MRYSHQLSDAVHILTYLAIYPDGDLSSQRIAGSINANPSLVRRLMALLSKAGLLNSRAGVSQPSLAQPADQITLLMIYQALEDAPPLLHVDPKTNPDCVVGGNIQETLSQVYADVQTAAEQQMAQVTLAAIMGDILERQASKPRA